MSEDDSFFRDFVAQVEQKSKLKSDVDIKSLLYGVSSDEKSKRDYLYQDEIDVKQIIKTALQVEDESNLIKYGKQGPKKVQTLY